MKSPHGIGSSNSKLAGINTSVHSCTKDEAFFKELMQAKNELLAENRPITLQALSLKSGKAYVTIRNFLGKNLVYRHKLKIVPAKRGPKN
jgi:hypothetical protein